MARRSSAALKQETTWRDGPIHDPRVSVTQPMVPPSWADQRFVPQAGMFCSACRYGKFWTAGTRGWCCMVCHPPLGLDQADLTVIDTVTIEIPEPEEAADA